MKAIWNGCVVADSEVTVVVEGNHYFPRESMDRQYFEPSAHTTRCFWKGTARYFNVVVNGDSNANAAWYYPDPNPAAEQIRNRVAFWKGVTVQ